MEAWMIIILIIGAIFAIAFNVWNKKNPVGGGASKKQYQQRQLTDEEKRTFDQWDVHFKNQQQPLNQHELDNLARYEQWKRQKQSGGTLYDSEGKRIR